MQYNNNNINNNINNNNINNNNNYNINNNCNSNCNNNYNTNNNCDNNNNNYNTNNNYDNNCNNCNNNNINDNSDNDNTNNNSVEKLTEKPKSGLLSTLNFNYNKNSVKKECKNTTKKNNKNDKNALKTFDSSSKFMKNYMIEDIDKCLDICDSAFNKIKSDPFKNNSSNNDVEILYNKKIKNDSPVNGTLNEYNLKALNDNAIDKGFKGNFIFMLFHFILFFILINNRNSSNSDIKIILII